MKKFFKWLFISLGVFLVVAELCARLLFGLGNAPLFEASDNYGYKFIPNQDIHRFGNRIYFNSYGLRSEEINEEPSLGVTRILCIGDSITYGGQWIDQSNTYPYILERLLNEKSEKKFEVLNVSAPSWGIQNEEAYLKKHDTYNSNIIILQLDRGDLFSVKASSDVVGNSPFYPDKKFVFALQEVFIRYVFTHKNVFIAKSKQSMSANKILDDNMQSLKRIVELIRNNETKLVVIYVPTIQEIKNKSLLLKPGNKAFYSTVEQLNVPFLNLADKFERYNSENIFRDKIHPNPDGNRAIAEALADLILNSLNK